MTHSSNYERYVRYYKSGFWTKQMLYNVTAKGKLYAWEYTEATGEPFEN